MSVFALLTVICAESSAPLGDAVVEAFCGRHSLALITRWLTDGTDQLAWHDLLPSEQAPFNVAALDAAARAEGFETLIVAWTDPAEADLSCPGVLHVRHRPEAVAPDHFVACFGTRGNDVCLGDYPNPPALVPRDKLRHYWTGTVLYVAKPGDPRLAALRLKLWQGPIRRGLTALSVAVLTFCGAHLALSVLRRWRRPALSKGTPS